MVKHLNVWGTVCDDGFNEINAQAACRLLGYGGGAYSNHNPGFSESEVPILMDNVSCDSGTTNFLLCKHAGWEVENCSHSEDVLLTCT